MNKSKHINVKYTMDTNKVAVIINSFNFKDMEDISLYEVETYKNSITMDNPIYFFSVL